MWVMLKVVTITHVTELIWTMSVIRSDNNDIFSTSDVGSFSAGFSRTSRSSQNCLSHRTCASCSLGLGMHMPSTCLRWKRYSSLHMTILLDPNGLKNHCHR